MLNIGVEAVPIVFIPLFHDTSRVVINAVSTLCRWSSLRVALFLSFHTNTLLSVSSVSSRQGAKFVAMVGLVRKWCIDRSTAYVVRFGTIEVCKVPASRLKGNNYALGNNKDLIGVCEIGTYVNLSFRLVKIDRLQLINK